MNSTDTVFVTVIKHPCSSPLRSTDASRLYREDFPPKVLPGSDFLLLRYSPQIQRPQFMLLNSVVQDGRWPRVVVDVGICISDCVCRHCDLSLAFALWTTARTLRFSEKNTSLPCGNRFHERQQIIYHIQLIIILFFLRNC